jgi:cytochrome P450
LRYVSTAVKELKSYMYGMIRDRKQEIKSGETSSTVRRDLFNQLITASLEESAMEKTPGSQGLTDEELVGSVTVLMLVERLYEVLTIVSS